MKGCLLFTVGLASVSADVFNEMESLRAEVLAQRQLIKDQQERFQTLVDPRRLQTSGLLTTATFDAEVQTLKNTQYSMGGAMDSAWLCLCG
ncbi:unnamed protein product, partial [Symbiodinium sp. KB8]